MECDLELKPMLEKIFTLYALTVVERNLPWFILTDTLTTEQGLQVRGLFVWLSNSLTANIFESGPMPTP